MQAPPRRETLGTSGPIREPDELIGLQHALVTTDLKESLEAS